MALNTLTDGFVSFGEVVGYLLVGSAYSGFRYHVMSNEFDDAFHLNISLFLRTLFWPFMAAFDITHTASVFVRRWGYAAWEESQKRAAEHRLREAEHKKAWEQARKDALSELQRRVTPLDFPIEGVKNKNG